MLSDHELAELRDIERRLRWQSPALVRLFNSQEPQQAPDHRKQARTRVFIAGAALTGLALLGPRILNEGEIQTQRRPPPTASARRADLVSGPAGSAAVVDIVLAAPIIIAPPLWREA